MNTSAPELIALIIILRLDCTGDLDVARCRSAG